MTDVITIRSKSEIEQLRDGAEVVLIGDFLAYGSGSEFYPELAKKSDQYKVFKNCQLRLAGNEAISVSLEDKLLPLPREDRLQYPDDTDTPFSGKTVERDDKVAVHDVVELTTDPHSGRQLLRLISRSSQLRPAQLF